MILPFSTQLNGKPTYFIEKIWEGLLRTVKDDVQYISHLNTHEEQFGKHWDFLPDEADRMTNPKIHTIREDKKERWKPGIKIDFFINCRQKNMFRFAPVLPVVSVQEIFMTRRGTFIEISIAKIDSYIGEDDFQLNGLQIEQLALNDGFDEYNDFRIYFSEVIEKNGKATGNYWFKGKIIHWTDLKY
ncbi:MAG: hypothetical protein H7239_15630 [Flavobacterium sp.]|nr:hypothetical protein [Flavobacterium sp.]